jgi:hypothetical protein
MDSLVALLRFVQADARKVVLSRREDTRLDQGNAKRGRSHRGSLSDREGRARERRRSILEDGNPEMIFKDLLGNIMEHAAVVALAESVGQGSSEVRRLCTSAKRIPDCRASCLLPCCGWEHRWLAATSPARRLRATGRGLWQREGQRVNWRGITDGGRSIPVDEERFAPDRRVTSQFGLQGCAAGPVKLPD